MKNRVIKNASWIIVCKVIQSFLSLIIGTITARYLGPSNYGLINYAAAIVAFVVPIMQLGFRNTLVREIIANPEEEGEIVGTALVLNVTSSVMCIVCIIVFVLIFNRGEKETILVCIFFSLNLIFQALEMIQYWFQAKLQSKYTAIISMIAYVIVSLYKIYLLCTNKSIYWFALSQTLDFMIISLALVMIYKRVGGRKLFFSLKKAKQMLNVSKHYILSSMMVVVFGYIGNVFLKFLIDESAVGYYTAAITCAGIANFIYAAIIDSVRPTVLQSKESNYDLYEKKLVQLYSIIITLTVLQSVCITIFGDILVKILYGEKYVHAIVPLKIYTWQTVFSQIGTIRNVWILAENKQKYLWIINMCGAITSVILNWIFIPAFGVSGAAISAVATQFITNVIMSYIIKPIRKNNEILLEGCNLKVFIELIKIYFMEVRE